MIDLHCHILPGVDDGAVDVDDAVAMAMQGADDGITAICATPHIRHDHDVLIEEIAPRVEELNAELRRREVPVRILPAGEVAETALHALTNEELHAVALGGGRWVLLEPAPGPLSDSLAEATAHLSARGYGALIAHPERHFGPGWEEHLLALAHGGALVQVTAALLEDGETSPILGLARRGLVHVLGSDAHSARAGRPVRLRAGLAGLRHADRMRPHLRWVSEVAPRAIVSGEPLQAPFAAD